MRSRHARRGWHLLLAVPVVAALAVPLYDRREPELAGLPLFYWFQLALVPLAILVTTVVYQATKRRP